MASGRLIQRVVFPRVDFGLDDATLGGQHPWVWAIGLPYRALAAPWSGTVMPENPRALLRHNEYGHVAGDFDHAIGYFVSLQSFLTYSFGWTRHDKGLLWWVDQGSPVEDSRFALIRDVWLADGMFDRYLVWCVQHPVLDAFDAFEPHVDREPVTLSSTWRQRLHDAQSEAEAGDLSLRPDQMHLQSGMHISGPSAGRGDARLLGVDPGSRSAVLISDSVAGWYAALVTAGNELSTLPDGRSWRIDVHVKPIGFVGTYRRSRDTGLWFAGRHAHHTVGN